MRALNSVGMAARVRPDGRWDALLAIGSNPSLGIAAHSLVLGAGPWASEDEAIAAASKFLSRGDFEPESAGSTRFEYQRQRGRRLTYTVILNGNTYLVKYGDTVVKSGQRVSVESGIKPWQADLLFIFDEIERMEDDVF
jgi:hypothetical protein